MIVLSHFQAKALLQSRGKYHTMSSTQNLGISQVEVELEDQVYYPTGEALSWEMVEHISGSENKCFLVQNGEIIPIQEYSDAYNRVYSLYPTESAPTMLVSGIPMHRIKGINPWEDTHKKIHAFGRVGGHVLDTTTGLGYTAILAAEYADQVTTVEIDPAAQKIAIKNPWSQPLFNHPRIRQVIGDSADVIHEFEASTCSGIIHDPPMFKLAGNLYALRFYQEAHRVLKPKGVLFHYIGNPKSKTGTSVTRGVLQRLSQAGFTRVISKPDAFGVVAFK